MTGAPAGAVTIGAVTIGAVLVGAVLVVLAAVAVVLLRRRVVAVSVTGLSMAPTLHAGDRVLVRRTPVDRLQRGDVVVVREPGPCRPGDPDGLRGAVLMVKRVAALPGDPAPAVLPAWARGGGVVPPGRLVVLGDNPGVSLDSRHFGPVGAERLLGVVVRRLGGGTLPAAPEPVDG